MLSQPWEAPFLLPFSAPAGGSAECLADSSAEDKTSWVPIHCPSPSVDQGCPVLSGSKSGWKLRDLVLYRLKYRDGVLNI